MPNDIFRSVPNPRGGFDVVRSWDGKHAVIDHALTLQEAEAKVAALSAADKAAQESAVRPGS